MIDKWRGLASRAIVRISEAATIYVAVSASSAALASLVCDLLHGNSQIWSAAGFALPIGPLYAYFASDLVMEAKLKRWGRWNEEKLISTAEHKALREVALEWYKARRGYVRRPEAPRMPREPDGTN